MILVNKCTCDIYFLYRTTSDIYLKDHSILSEELLESELYFGFIICLE